DPRSRSMARLTASLVVSGPGVNSSFGFRIRTFQKAPGERVGARRAIGWVTTASELDAQHHLNRARAGLLHSLALADDAEGAAGHVDVGDVLVQNIEEVRELCFVAQRETLR